MRYDDALDRLGQLRSSTQRLVGDFMSSEPSAAAPMLRKILLAFEWRWKLEDLVLMPALKDTQGVMLCGTRDVQRELVALRNLATVAREDGTNLARQRVLLSAIDTLASLRSQRVGLALARAERAAVVDTRALGLEMDQLLERCRGDAAGLAPRPSSRGSARDEATAGLAA